MANDTVSVGFVGYGRMAEFHRKALAESRLFECVAAADITPARREAARAEGMKAFERMEELLDTNVELVYITTHSSTHHEIALKVARAGKHMVVEKPMALRGEHADEMIAAAREAEVMITVYHTRRWTPEFRRVKKAVSDGVLGEIFLVEHREHSRQPAVGFGTKAFNREWRITRAMGGGTIYDFGPHLLDSVLNLIPGKVVQVMGDVRHFQWGDADDYFDIRLILDSGARASVGKCDVAYQGPPRWLIYGTEGTLKSVDINGEKNQILVWGQSGPQLQLDADPLPSPQQNYYDVLRKGGQLLVTADESARTVHIIDAAFRSADIGRSVDVSI